MGHIMAALLSALNSSTPARTLCVVAFMHLYNYSSLYSSRIYNGIVKEFIEDSRGSLSMYFGLHA